VDDGDRLFPDEKAPPKACRKCGVVKPLSEFYQQRGMKDGHRHNCMSCHKQGSKDWYSRNREDWIQHVAQWKRTNRDRVNASNRRRRVERGDELKRKERAGHLRRKYGLKLSHFDMLVTAQLGMCAICHRIEMERLHVDHDHASGRVRGLLCGKCNKAIGLLGDDPRLVLSAETYLRRMGSK
jgi:hypothetical protein